MPVVEDERDLALEDVEQLAAALGMNLAFVRVAGLERPVPELGRGWVLRADEEGSPAALVAAPEAHPLSAGDTVELRLVAALAQRRDPDAERRRQPTQRCEARICPALLELDDHALADAGAGGQSRQRPAARLPQRTDIARDCGCHGVGVRSGTGHGGPWTTIVVSSTNMQ